MSTWYEQIAQAEKLNDAELWRHASISVGNRHACHECFTCASANVLADRNNTGYEYRQMSKVLQDANMGCCPDDSIRIQVTSQHEGTKWLTMPPAQLQALITSWCFPQSNDAVYDPRAAGGDKEPTPEIQPFKETDYNVLHGGYVCVGRNRKCGTQRSITYNGVWVKYGTIFSSAHSDCI